MAPVITVPLLTPRTTRSTAMDKRTAERMQVLVVGFGVASTLGVYGVSGLDACRSTAIGAVLALINWLLLRFLVGLVVSSSMRSKPLLAFMVLLKMGALMGLIAYCVASDWVQPIPFVVGLSSLVVGLLLGSVLYIARTAAGSER